MDSKTICCIKHFFQFCIISILLRMRFAPIIQVINKEVKQYWTQSGPLWYTTVTGLQVGFILLITLFESGSCFSIWPIWLFTSPFLINLSVRVLWERASKALVRISSIYCFALICQTSHLVREAYILAFQYLYSFYDELSGDKNNFDEW